MAAVSFAAIILLFSGIALGLYFGLRTANLI
jgi:hypothetical protein